MRQQTEGAPDASDARSRDPADLFRLEALQPPLGLGLAEIASSLVPEARLGRIATHAAKDVPAQQSWIEGASHPQRRAPVSCIGSALIEEARRGGITSKKESVTARQKLRNLLGREMRQS
jgi:predicted component of type VI protein secretion system